jgi:hypothetical protein
MPTHPQAIDFARSYCHYVPRGYTIWVRIQAECRCEIFDTVTGESDEYVLGVRTQTGLRTDPPSDVLDPGYDFWMIFSRKHIFVRRTHASAYASNPTRVPVDEFISTGWQLTSVDARQLHNASEILAALQAGERLVARTEFTSADGQRGYRIEYPIKWADGDSVQDAFRVETGPVLLMDVEQVGIGVVPEFDDFQWSYLDFHTFDQIRYFTERPTSILSGALYEGSPETPRRSAALTPEQLKQIERRLFEGWDPPIPIDQLRRLFETNHYSEVSHRAATTVIFALEDAHATDSNW